MNPAERLREDATQLRRWGRHGSIKPLSAEAMAKRVEACADLVETASGCISYSYIVNGERVIEVNDLEAALKRAQESCDETG